MAYTRKDDWEDDYHYYNSGVHYRLYISPHDHRATVICVQDFDYLDYDARRILSPKAWATEDQAVAALLQLAPALVAAHHDLKDARIDLDLVDFLVAEQVRQAT